MKASVPNELLQQIARNNCVAFVGAGPSKLAGFPDWYQLLHSMIAWSETHGVENPNKTDIAELMRKKDLLAAADTIRSNMGDQKYFAFLRETFLQPSASPTDFHRFLVQIPFVGIGTSNYEGLIESAYKEANSTKPLKILTQLDHSQLGVALHSKGSLFLRPTGQLSDRRALFLEKSITEN